jgi:AcrR family transcriptional regulator
VQSRSEETRKRILETALERFSKDGYDATGVAEICKAAGVSKGAFYHHFHSKQAVFLALMDDWLADLDVKLRNVRLAAHNVPDGLVAMAGMTGELSRDSKDRYAIIFEFWIQASRQPEIWKAAIAPYHRYLEVFAGIIQDGIDEGSLDGNIKPTYTAHMLLSLVLGLLLQAYFDPESTTWDSLAQESIRMFIEGIKRRPS